VGVRALRRDDAAESRTMAKKRSLMFNLGAFFGNVARGFTAPVDGGADSQADRPGAPSPKTPPTTVVRTDVQEQVVNTDRGPLTLRRTVIDEVVPPAPGSSEKQQTPG
jgi:hypothetical protein